MKFPDSYFEGEVREGFFVTSMMKRAWAAQLEVLEDLDLVCRKYDIAYFADWGTLLGAVRHRGFIPWDDDLDICMKREDYNRFLAVAKKELPESYVLHNIYMDETYSEMFTRVLNSREICFREEFLKKFHGCPYGMGIDVFVMDYIAPNLEEEKTQLDLLRSVWNIVAQIDAGVLGENECEVCANWVEQLLNIKLDRNQPLRKQLYLLGDQLSSLYKEQEANEITIMQLWMKNEKYRMPKSYYDKAIWLPFENTKIPVPYYYNAALQKKYGDYMHQVYHGASHDYPVYQRQEEILKNKIGKNPYAYTREDFFAQEEAVNKQQKKEKRKKSDTQYEVIFLPYKASEWDGLESVWKAAKEDKNCISYVIPIPYFYKKADGSMGEMQYEAGLFPKEVPITRYDTFDFEGHHPDAIYIQNPYDEYDSAISIHPFFYSKNLKKYTRNLVYIPHFILNENLLNDAKSVENLKSCCAVPGVMRADKVIVQSENMRQIYVNVLTGFAGEHSREKWEEKIVGIGSPKMDKDTSSLKSHSNLPESWNKVVAKPDGSRKKIVLYYVSLSVLLENEKEAFEKIKSVFAIFKERQEEIALLWVLDEFIQEWMEAKKFTLWEEYENLIRQLKEEGWGICDTSGNLERAVALCDAYYGDRGHIAQLCLKENVPILMQDIKVR